MHAQDVQHTFCNLDVAHQGLPIFTILGDHETVAYVMQDYFTSFAAQGIPESQLDGLAAVPTYGANATLTVLGSDGIFTGADPAANERCAWWQMALAE